MTNAQNRKMHRAIALFVILLMVFSVLALSSCGSARYSIEENETDIQFVARMLKTNSNATMSFIAASRGYDISSEDFVDGKEDLGANITVAKAVLNNLLDELKFTDNTEKSSKDTFISVMNDLNAESIAQIVDSLGSTYDLAPASGFSQFILGGIGKMLNWVTGIVGGQYLVAVLIFAVLVEIVMLPFSIMQQKNSIKMAKLAPKESLIYAKYKGRNDQNSRRKLQEELMAFRQKEGFSPMSGCLPLIIQLIVVGFILYPIIQNPLRYMLGTSEGFSNALLTYATAPMAVGGLGIELSSAGNVIELLTQLNADNMLGITSFPLIENGAKCYNLFTEIAVPNFTLFGINLGVVPGFTSILVLVPILNAVFQWVSMQLTKKWGSNAAQVTADPTAQSSTKIMEIVMPLIMLPVLFSVPALIGLYWLFRSIISLIKQFILKNIMPVPRYTEEEIKAMRKAQKEQEKAQRAIMKAQPKYKSLHYIDEEDYEELPQVKNSPNKNSINSTNKPEIKD